MTRLWVAGVAVQMTASGGVPQRFVWRGQVYRLAWIANHWRVWRDYWKLVTRTDLLVVVYHDLPDGEWYLQRLYD